MNKSSYSKSFTKNFGTIEEWYKDALPHRHKDGLLQFITFRLADSLPQKILGKIQDELNSVESDNLEKEKNLKYQYWLDQSLGSCVLSNYEMAKMMLETLTYYDGIKYSLLAWSIMPNHVHVLIKSQEDIAIIVRKWKTYSAKWALKNDAKFKLGLNKEQKNFWMKEYWDRFIRNAEHFDKTIKYILDNPKEAHLPKGHIAHAFTGCIDAIKQRR